MDAPAATEESSTLMASILSSSTFAVVSSDGRDRVTAWSRGAKRIYGYEAAEIEHRSILGLVFRSQQSEVAEMLEQVRQGGYVEQQESIGVTKHGSPIDLELSISPVRSGAGEVVGACTLARDVTRQRWTEATVERSLHALEEALDAATESEAGCQRFLSDAAHQLRTPIAGIQTCADALLRGTSVSRREVLLAHVLRETARVSRLMTGLLHITRLDQGEIRAPRRCSVFGICADEVERVRMVATEIDVVVSSTNDWAGEVVCDVDALREILSNLLDNARRHATETIEVVAGCEGDCIRVRVTDDGPGVAESLRERIFERFVSLDGKGGSGLGLPIARGLARGQGGDLEWEDGGFVLRLPFEARTASGSWGGQVAPPPIARSA